MASEIGLQSIRQFLLDRGGTVRNKELVKHFKDFLNDPATKGDEASYFGSRFVH